MPVGVAGLHNVCVCTYHQNVKLMLKTVNTSLNYNDVLKLCVFSIENSDCMLNHCDLCPEQTVVHNFLKEKVLLNYMIDDLIKHKQWVSINTSNLEEHEDDFDDFHDKLTSMIFELTEHHFIAKKQSEFLRVKKASLKFDEPVLIQDFTENYLFIVQDYAQSNNAQATIHAFILYYLNPETLEISSASFSFISNHMTQNTTTVYVFPKTLINDHIRTRYPFLKSISYFGDGSPAQYENYKNFTNLLMHKKDFGMKALPHHVVRMHVMELGGTTKRLAACASLQRAIHNQTLNTHQLYDFANSGVPGVTSFFVGKQQFDVVSKFLTSRYENTMQFRSKKTISLFPIVTIF